MAGIKLHFKGIFLKSSEEYLDDYLIKIILSLKYAENFDDYNKPYLLKSNKS